MIPNCLSPRTLGAIKQVGKLEGNKMIIAANSWSAAGAAELPPHDRPSQHPAAASFAPTSASAPPLPSDRPAVGAAQKPSSVPFLPMLSQRPAASAASAPTIPAGAPRASRLANQHLTIRNESRLPLELTMANLEVAVLLRAVSRMMASFTQTPLPPGEALAYVIPAGTTVTMSCLGSEAQLPFSVNFALGDGQNERISFLWTFPAPSALGEALPQAVLASAEGESAPASQPGSFHMDTATSCITFKRGGRGLRPNPSHLPM
jgi:hypothetical protein